MRFIVKILDFLVATNVYVALAVASLTSVSLSFCDAQNYDFLYFVFFSTIFIYNFIRLVNVAYVPSELDSYRHHFIYKLRPFLWFFCIASAIAAFYFVIDVYRLVFYPMLLIVFISLAYGLPIYKKSEKWLRLRDVPGLKIFLIAYIWAWVTEGLPAVINTHNLDVLAFVERFLFIFAITIPFDIRDLSFDDFNLATIPQYFGLRKAKWIGMIALLIAELILAYRFFFESNLDLWGAIAIYLTYECSAFLVYKSHPKLQERFVTIGVEGMSILMAVLYFSKDIILNQ